MYQLPITAEKVEKLRLEAKASGNSPKKMAVWATAKRQYEDLIETLFDEETPFYSSPTHDYVNRLEMAAKSGAEIDIARFELSKEARDRRDRSISGESDRAFKTSVHDLHAALQSGEKVTQAHLKQAGLISASNPSIQNLAVYATVKRQLEQEEAGA